MKNKDKLYFGLVILCLLSIFGLLAFMKGETTQCVQNPFVYGAEKMGDVECYCIQDKSSPSAYFKFNSTYLGQDNSFTIFKR